MIKVIYRTLLILTVSGLLCGVIYLIFHNTSTTGFNRQIEGRGPQIGTQPGDIPTGDRLPFEQDGRLSGARQGEGPGRGFGGGHGQGRESGGNAMGIGLNLGKVALITLIIMMISFITGKFNKKETTIPT